MSVNTQLDRLENAKAAIKTAIEGKGVTVPSTTKLDEMAPLIESITPMLQSKSVTITSNGTIKITPDSEYDALSEAIVTVDVSGSGVKTCSVSVKSIALIGGHTMLYSFQEIDDEDNVIASAGTMSSSGSNSSKTFSSVVTDSLIMIIVTDSSRLQLSSYSDNIGFKTYFRYNNQTVFIFRAPSVEGASGEIVLDEP